RDHAGRFPAVAEAIRRLPAATLILDGEIAPFDENLVSRFHLLHEETGELATPPIFVAKNEGSRYSGGPTTDWCKVKVRHEGRFPRWRHRRRPGRLRRRPGRAARRRRTAPPGHGRVGLHWLDRDRPARPQQAAGARDVAFRGQERP